MTGGWEHDGLSVIRAREDVRILEDPTGPRIMVLASKTGTYARLPKRAVDFLRELTGRPRGMTPLEAEREYPGVRLPALWEFGLIDVVPPGGLAVDRRLVLRLWLENLMFRSALARHGWQPMATALDRPPTQGNTPVCRPLLFDAIESAARVSFSLPGTSRQCTTVSLAVDSVLRACGYAARPAVLGEHDQIFLHACVRVGAHVVDPGDTLPELREFTRLG